MANKNFVVHNGLTVGLLTIDAASGDINTPGNVNISGSVGVSQIAKNDSSIAINDTGFGSSVVIKIDNSTEHTVDADGVNLAAGNRFAIAGNSVLNGTTLGATVVNSSLTTLGNLTALSVAGDTNIYGNLTVQGLATLNGGTLTIGDGDTDNVVFGADINSNVRPNTNNTYSLGTSGAVWAGVFANALTAGSGSGTGVVKSNGTYDLQLTTNDGSSNNPKITLSQSDDGNITLDPSGTGVSKVLSTLFVGTGSTSANIASLGAYDLWLSTNQNVGRAYIKLSGSTNGNIEFGLNGTGTVKIPEITFGDNTTQTSAALPASLAASMADATALAIALG